MVDSSLDYFQEKFISDEKQNLIIVINDIVNDFEDYPLEVYISKNRVLTSLSAILYDLKNSSGFDGKFYSVQITNISLGEVSPCDIYFKLSKSKYVKIVNKGDVFDEDLKNRYESKSEFLWVDKNHFYLFGEFLYGHDSLDKKISVDFSVENTSHLKFVYDMAQSCGISEKTIRSVQASAENIKENSKGKIKKLLASFEKMEGTFLFSHSHFLSLLCVEVATKQAWFKKQHIDKLVMASLVHDMGYKNPKNAENEALLRSKIEELSLEVRDDTLNHISEVIKILETNESVDSDVINIIKWHHGARGEESYPQKSFATEMDLLSGIFLLCHAFSLGMFQISFEKKKVASVLAYVEGNYNKGSLKKVYPEFQKSIVDLLKD